MCRICSYIWPQILVTNTAELYVYRPKSTAFGHYRFKISLIDRDTQDLPEDFVISLTGSDVSLVSGGYPRDRE